MSLCPWFHVFPHKSNGTPYIYIYSCIHEHYDVDDIPGQHMFPVSSDEVPSQGSADWVSCYLGDDGSYIL